MTTAQTSAIASSSSLPILEVENVSLAFGGTRALQDVSMQVMPGTILGVIGPNGAGKSSLLNCLNGFYRPTSGSISYRGKSLTKLKPPEIARLGIARTFQSSQLFPEMTVLDNILFGRHIHTRRSLWRACVHWGPGRAEEVRQRLEAERVIEFLELESIRKNIVGALSYGKQKMVEIGRAIAMEPSLLLLDEPTSGMNREEKEDVARFILRMKHETSITQVLIEHDLRFISDLCDRVVVLDVGTVLAAGDPRTVLTDERVIQAYVGRRVSDRYLDQ